LGAFVGGASAWVATNVIAAPTIDHQEFNVVV